MARSEAGMKKEGGDEQRGYIVDCDQYAGGRSGLRE